MEAHCDDFKRPSCARHPNRFIGIDETLYGDDGVQTDFRLVSLTFLEVTI
jgi:hypothetical protein